MEGRFSKSVQLPPFMPLLSSLSAPLQCNTLHAVACCVEKAPFLLILRSPSSFHHTGIPSYSFKGKREAEAEETAKLHNQICFSSSLSLSRGHSSLNSSSLGLTDRRLCQPQSRGHRGRRRTTHTRERERERCYRMVGRITSYFSSSLSKRESLSSSFRSQDRKNERTVLIDSIFV